MKSLLLRKVAWLQIFAFLFMLFSPSALALEAANNSEPKVVFSENSSDDFEYDSIGGSVVSENAVVTEEAQSSTEEPQATQTKSSTDEIKATQPEPSKDETEPKISDEKQVNPATDSQEDKTPEPSDSEEKTITEEQTKEEAKPEEAKPDEVKPDDEAVKADETQAGKITAVVIDGNVSVPTDEIIRVLSVKIGDPLVETKVQRDIQSIFDMGYFTDVKIDTRYFIGGVKLIFSVLENPTIKNIVFEGNSIVPSDKLISLMETKTGVILNTKTLFGDMGTINQYYDEELGYLYKPTHIKDLKWTEDGDLKISLIEGLAIDKIEITGNTVFPTDKLMSYITFHKGEVFNQKIAKTDSDKIAALYEESDYILDTIRPNMDTETGTVSIRIVEAVLEEIKIEGNKRTKDYVIYRNMNTRVGQVLKRKRIQKDLERLNNIGYFSSVNVEPEAGSELGKVILVVKVKEQKTGTATIGLGYLGGGSSAVKSGIAGSLSVSERNFKGTGWGAGASAQIGVNTNSLNLSIFNPAINSSRDSIGFTVYSQKYVELAQAVPNSDPVAYSYYDDERTGFTATYGHPLSEYLSLFLTLKTENVDLKRSNISDYEPIGLFSGKSNSAILSAVYDSRDDMFNPLSGTFLNASYQNAGGFLGGTDKFSKTQLEIRKYIPLGKSTTLALRAWGGILSGQGAYTSEYFYMGGSDTLRGYRDNIFLGDHMLLFSAELRFPIAKLKVLSGAIFVDAGNAWFEKNGSGKLHTDAGVGLRLTLPTLGLGVIRLDYAFGENGGRTTIGFGQSF